MVKVETRYQWLYLIGFVCPQTGQTYWLIMPSINITVLNLALEHFARGVGAGKNKRIILVLDGAGWHSSKQVVVPEGLELFFLPPYSPELQPAERLWPLTNQVLLNRNFADLDELEQVQADWCLLISERTQQVKALTCYHWWPKCPS